MEFFKHGKILLLKMYFHVYDVGGACGCAHVSMMWGVVWACACLWRSEEGAESPGDGVTGDCDCPALGAGD